MVNLEVQAHRVRGFLGAFGPAQVAAAHALEGKLSAEEIENVKSAICAELTKLVSKENWAAHNAVYR
jgi:hypothetical protein